MSMREYYENLDQYAIYDYKDVKNAYGYGEADAVDRVLEIISKEEEEFEQGYALDVSKYGFACAASLIRDKVLALKGGEQDC